MLTTENVHTARRERLIKGADNWWFLGPGGTAKVRPEHLAADGVLTRSAEDTLRAAGLYDIAAYRVYSLTVLTSTDCNLGCSYCFQNTGQDLTGGSRPPRITHSRLTSETIGKVLDFTGRQMAAAGLERLSVLLFGGEPLLNLKGCQELLTRAADYGMRGAQMISNGVLLTPLVARALSERGLRTVQITFDGDQHDHDLIRVRRSGGGTFDAIIDNVRRVADETPLRFQLRVNVSHLNRSGMDAMIERLADELDPARCSLSFVRVGDVGIGFANEMLHAGGLAEDFIRWNRRALALGFRVSRPGAHAACQTCSFKDGKYGAVVNPDGTLYSCWETSGKPGWDVGSAEVGYRPEAETDGKWETCAGLYRFDEERAVLEDFADAVDAALLDDLSLAGKL